LHRRIGRAALVLGCACTLGSTAAAAPAEAKPDGPLRPAAGELIVGFAPAVSTAERAGILERVGGREKRAFGRIRAALVSAPRDAAAAIAELEADPRVRYAERNRVVHAVDHTSPNDPAFHQLWGLDNFGQTVNGVTGAPDADIDAPEAWAVTKGGRGVVVGVLDTGIAFGHPDLAGAQWVNPGEDCAGCRADGVDNDGNGYVDDWRGWDFANDDNDPTDDNGHGTHVAGIIGATGNDGAGVVGVNWDVRLMALKFLDSRGSGTTADAVEALLYATAHGVPVTNNSWAGSSFSQAMLDTLRQADSGNSLFVAAAGNTSANLDTTPDYPVAYDAPNILTVAATTATDSKAYFSSHGRRSVDLGAPGMNVYSTWVGDSYRYASGSSMAAPHVAGAAALAKAAFPGASDVGLKALLLRTVDARTGLASYVATGGRLNAGNAVGCLDAPKLWVESPAAGFEAIMGEPIAVTVLAGRCAEPGGVTVSATVNGTPVELVSRGDGLYAGHYVPAVAGELTFTASATASGAADTRSVAGAASRAYEAVAGGLPLTLALGSGENARVRFPGTAGQRVALKVSDVTVGSSTCCSMLVSLVQPDGSALVLPTYVGTTGAFIDTRTLPGDGTYTVVVDPQGSASGGVTLALYDVPPDPTGAIEPGGPPVTATADQVGQNAKVLFDGVAGRRISLVVRDVTIGTSTCCSLKLSVLRPGGTLVAPAFVGTAGGFMDTRTLPVSGTYTIVVDPQSTSTGSATLTLHHVPPDVSGSLPMGGAALPVDVSTPGQNATLTFTGAAGATVTLGLTEVTIGTSSCCGSLVSVRRPDGTTLVGGTFFGTSGKTLTMALPVGGTYRVFVDPQKAATGGVTVAVARAPS
jgi:subtilisin family serine protease